MEKVSVEKVLEFLREQRNIEVKGYEGEYALVDKVHGIVKGTFEKSELADLRRRRPRKRCSQRLLQLVTSLAERLLRNRVPFKVVFGAGDVTIRFDLDHYLRLEEGTTRVVGFGSLDEPPLNLVKDLLEKYGTVKFLRPVR